MEIFHETSANSIQSICVFCGSSAGRQTEYRAAAVQLGTLLAQRGIRLVFGGGQIGLMGILADAVLVAGGEAVGVIPQALMHKELGHRGLTRLHIVGSMHERKALMAELSDAFAALPGGIGTLEEFCEVVTWAQLGIHSKPCGMLNTCGYFDPLLAMLQHALAEQFLRPEHLQLVLTASAPEALLDLLATYRPPAMPKWISLEKS